MRVRHSRSGGMAGHLRQPSICTMRANVDQTTGIPPQSTSLSESSSVSAVGWLDWALIDQDRTRNALIEHSAFGSEQSATQVSVHEQEKTGASLIRDPFKGLWAANWHGMCSPT